MRLSAASVVLAALFSISLAAAPGDFPKLSTVVLGGASKTSKAAEKTADSTGGATSGGSSNFPVETGVDGAVPTYPAPTIPPTTDAPFMQKSSLPQGTVFICVGAGLGFLLACVLAWRGFLMWTVHRNIRRANAGYVGLAPQGPQSTKRMGAGLLEGSVGILKKKSPFYGAKTTDGSTMSLSPLTAGEPKSRSASGNAMFGSAPSKSSLFFSPTAGAISGAGAGIPAANLGVKRGEGYLPAGYYAGGNQAGAGGADRASRQLSMADFDGRPQHSVDYGAAQTRGPGVRPDLRDTRRESQARLISTESRRDSSYSPAPRLGAVPNQSSLSLGSGIDGNRAPSAYLEDLFSASPVPQNEQRQ